jgi:hypothetical protein
MKKREQKQIHSSIKHVKLYREDIEKIISYLDIEGVNLEISDNENVYESLDELQNLKGYNPNLVVLTATLEKLSFDLLTVRITQFGVYIFMQHSEVLQMPTYQIERFIYGKKKSLISRFINSRFAIYGLSLSTLLAFVHYLQSMGASSDDFNMNFFIGLFSFWGVLLIYTELNPDTNTKIELNRRHEKNFYQKNKDKILLMLITAVVTGIVTFMLSNIGKN